MKAKWLHKATYTAAISLLMSLLPCNVQAAQETQVLETKYSSVDKGYITPVDTQGQDALCWAYALCGAVESNALVKGLGKYNLSELQVGYLVYSNNSLLASEGDKIIITGRDWNNIGGVIQEGVLRMSEGYTFLEESKVDASYPGEMTVDKCIGDGVLSIENVYNVNTYFRDDVKKAIKDYGSVICCMSFPNQDTRYYNNETAALYTDHYIEEFSHGILMVGWDDSYSKDNFATCKPEHDGAWLCKNSWGTQFGNNGYFWLSYEDYCAKNTIVNYVSVTKPDSRKILGYDSGIKHIQIGAEDIACEFTAESSLAINGIKFHASASSAPINLRILKNLSEDISEGDLLYSAYIKVDKDGYYTVNFDNIYLTKGTKYLVVLDGFNFYCAEVQSGQVNASTGTVYYSTEYSGHSYIYQNDKWVKSPEIASYNSSNTPINDVCLRVCTAQVSDEYAQFAESPVIYEYPEIRTLKSQKGNVTITWDKSDVAKKYYVYRSTSLKGKYKKIGTTTKTKYIDKKSLKNKKKYYYIISAVDEIGREFNSDAKSVKVVKK